MATAYQAPTYDEKKYRKGIDTSYYDQAIKDYTNQANTERASELSKAQKTQQANLKNAYISRMQNERRMNQNLATSGIRGGMTETANLNLMNQYGQARASANSDYANSVNQINQTYNRNIADYTSDMMSRAEEYRQNLAQAKWQAERESYGTKWQAQREDALRAEENKREDALRKEQYAREDKATAYDRNVAEKNRLTEYWSNYYTNYYSGYSKKNAKNAVKTLEAQLKKTTDSLARIKIEQAISGAKARLGVIASK